MTAKTLELPVLAEVLAARERIGKYLPPTQLRSYPSLSELVGTALICTGGNIMLLQLGELLAPLPSGR